VVGGEARTRGCGLPSYTRKVVLAFIQTRMKDFTHIPQLRSKDLLISCQRFCESFSAIERPLSTSPKRTRLGMVSRFKLFFSHLSCVSCHQGQSSGQYGHRLYTLFSLAFLDVPMKRTRPTLSPPKGQWSVE